MKRTTHMAEVRKQTVGVKHTIPSEHRYLKHIVDKSYRGWLKRRGYTDNGWQNYDMNLRAVEIE